MVKRSLSLPLKKTAALLFPKKPHSTKVDASVEQSLEAAVINLEKEASIEGAWNALRLGDYKNVQRLQISIPGAVSSYHWKKLPKFFQELGALPLLEEITFRATDGGALFEFQREMNLPVPAMKALFRAASKKKLPLRKLQFDLVFFPRDMDGPWTTLGQLPQLESLEICKCPEAQDDLTDLIENVSKLQSLKQLIVASWPYSQQCATATLQTLLESGTALEDVQLRALEVPAEGWTELAPLLQAHPNLHTLKLGQIELTTTESTEALVGFLTASTGLQDLEFTPRFAAPTRIQPYTEFNKDIVDEEEQIQLQEFFTHTLPNALKKNTNLRRCQLQLLQSDYKVHTDVQLAWLELVRDHNHVLEELRPKNLNNAIGVLYEDLGMYMAFRHNLSLNHLGRPQQCQPEDKQEWISALEKCRNQPDSEVSCAYDLLRMTANPGLV